MPIDPTIHAHMTYLVQREKQTQARAEELENDLEMWKQRVRLAEDTGEPELADQARQRARKLIARRRSLQDDLDFIGAEKDRLRKQSRMPSGDEVARSQAILRRWKASGLVDPDEAVVEGEFDELDAERALQEFKRAHSEQPDEPPGDDDDGDSSANL